ncbi:MULTISPECIES: ABC transporter substrate-binding protein [unclassified Planococcus (in: firmicutes)]|uniref:ABC transporter substrate-binding protein n=1 Tax=unclassified Planococcus (in: firmicutes) TaxID=2662419 RepID=UPI000C31FE39|nr:MULTISPECIES: ABC transporter substrate-binding protein [unclassified Planococcus (in: firmicutes)]AUD13847.1 ABC transporter substrate-binding protein [Planococcus sp. MB-3u-03]PKG45646.1 ABC transporter substrate-binding protein [Planococcus sp. Urea-trap-24]PKG88644.1 ABC transporter substrate-binding protein [Planococcus sp. Urea-3u-39]PKH38637.1 ABC transporter substrate-binding protein [Planococcus sp. MB-3u-09]
MKKWTIAIAPVLLLAACTDEAENPGSDVANEQQGLQEVTMVLDWTPNTNHTGLYVAQEKGYFEEQGLDVEIILPGEAGANQLVASNQAEFGIGAQESLTEARVQGIPIVSIAALIQHNTSGFASPKDKGIESPSDYEGKTYGGWGAPVEKAVLGSIMEQDDADVGKVDIVNIGNSDFFTAVERDIDFAWIYYGWTGIEAELRGDELNMQYLTDYSDKLDYYTPILMTNENLIAENPETVRAFTKAVSQGYEFAIDEPEQAAEILIEAVPDLDPELVNASQKWLSPKYQDDAAKFGEQQEQVWADYAAWMFGNGLLDEELDVEQAYTNEFLPEEEN